MEERVCHMTISRQLLVAACSAMRPVLDDASSGSASSARAVFLNSVEGLQNLERHAVLQAGRAKGGLSRTPTERRLGLRLSLRAWVANPTQVMGRDQSICTEFQDTF